MTNSLPKEFQLVNKFKRYSGNPIIRPQGDLAADRIFNPAAIVHDGKVALLCRCRNYADKPKGYNRAVSSLTWAWSDNGTDFKLDEKPFVKANKDSPYGGGFENLA